MNEKTKKTVLTAAKILISLVLLGFLVFSADLEQVHLAFQDFAWPWALLALVFVGLALVASAIKWGYLLQAQDIKRSVWDLYHAYVCGTFFNNFLPSSIGGDGVRILLLGRETGRTAAVASSVVAERALATVSLGLVGLGASFLVPEALLGVQVGLLLLALVGAALSLVIFWGWLPAFVRRGKGRFSLALQNFAEGGRLIRRHPAKVGLTVLWSLVFNVLVALVNSSLAQGLGLDIGFWPLLYAVCAASVLAMIPVGLNGYGLREGGYMALLAPFGVSSAQALALSVLFALSVSVYSLSGLPVWLSRGRRAPGASANEESVVQLDHA